jgi:hypothetical protein
VGLRVAKLHDKRSRGCSMHKCSASRAIRGRVRANRAVVGRRRVDMVREQMCHLMDVVEELTGAGRRWGSCLTYSIFLTCGILQS